MCHLRLPRVMFSTLTRIVQCLRSLHHLGISIPTEPKSNNCETKLLILFLLCSSIQSNTFQSNVMEFLSVFMPAVASVDVHVCCM